MKLRIPAAGLALASALTVAAATLPTATATAASTITATASTAGAAAPSSRQDGGRPGGVAPGLARGTLAGVVLGADGKPLARVCVLASGPAGSAAALTSVTGQYALTGLRAGSYVLAYRPCGAAGHYFPQWSGGASRAPAARLLAVAGGGTRWLAPVELRTVRLGGAAQGPGGSAQGPGGTAQGPGGTAQGPGGTSRRLGSAAVRPGTHGRVPAVARIRTGGIAGRVTGPSGGPLRGICVTAIGRGFSLGMATSRSGRYNLKFGLPPGRYPVEFSADGCGTRPGNWAPQFFRARASLARANKVTVRAGHVTGGISATMHRGAVITGAVSNVSGARLARACVALEHQGEFTAVRASAHGRYRFSGLAAGRYRVQFVTQGCGSTSRYLPQWWKNAKTRSRAAVIHLRAGQTRNGISAVLILGGQITGTVRLGNAAGRPLAGICVFVLQGGSSVTSPASTGRSGRYTVAGLRTGRYQVQFSPGCGSNPNVTSENFPHPVLVTAARVTAGINGVLVPGAIITGKVTSTGGRPLARICVDAFTNNDDGEALTGADGSYRINQLTAGDYTVSFSNCGGGSFAPQFYRGASIFEAATPVAVPASATVTGIDAVMPPGATISGSVTGRDGRKLSGVCVSVSTPGVAREPAEDVFPVAGAASRHGRYQLRNLAAGQYAVEFSIGCGGTADLAQQWYTAQPTGRTATLVTATPAAPATGISAVLGPGGAISGTLTSTAGHQLSNVCVTATQLGTGAGPELNFGGQGAYALAGLAPGRYRVEFSSCIVGGRYANQWFPRRDTREAAGSVRVTGGHTTTGVAGVLKVGGSISGKVTERAGGKPVAGACIENFGGPPGSENLALSRRDGSYRLGALSAGSYRLEVQMCDFGGPSLAVPNLASQVLGRTVRVALGQSVTGVGARLAAGGSVSGVVSGGSPPRAQPGVCVSVRPAHGDGPGSFATAGTSGHYLATGLAAGTYQVLFGDSSCQDSPPGLVPQWFRGQPDRATATRITVSAGATTSGISATLAPDGSISGTVTGPGGRASTGTCVVAVPLAGSQPVLAISRGGRYSLTVTAPGRYKVEFRPGCGAAGFATQWWKGATSRSAARVITVPARAEVTGISARLRRLRK